MKEEKNALQPKLTTKIYFDENISWRLAEAMSILEKGNEKPFEIIYVPRQFKQGEKDETWLPKIEKGSVVITKDKRIRRDYLKIIESNKLGCFYFIGKGLPKWIIVRTIVNKWEEIKKIIGKEKRPFAYSFSARSKLRKL